MLHVNLDLENLREEYLQGVPVVDLAQKYSVHKQTIYNRLISLGVNAVRSTGENKSGRPLGQKHLNYNFKIGDVLLGQIKLLEPLTKLRKSSKKGTYKIKAWRYEVIETGFISISSEQTLREMFKNRRQRKFRHHGKEQTGLNRLIKDYKRHAKGRDFEWALSVAEFKMLVTRNCFYCAVPPQQKIRSSADSETKLLYNGIDRKDNTRGYQVDNCVPCCGICNQAKMDQEFEQFKLWVGRLAKNYENIN